MGQVPEIYTVVGDGRLARHLRYYLAHCGLEVHSWARSSAQPFSPPSNHWILLAITDSALTPFVDALPQIDRSHFVHFSGALTIDGVSSCHPLMTFSTSLYPMETYAKIPFIFEKAPSKKAFTQIFPDLHNPSYAIQPELKPLYHALCVLGGNFSQILWQKVIQEFSHQLDLAPSILVPFMQQSLQNLIDDHEQALTGPLARGDSSTIAANLQALNNDPFRDVYRAMSEVFLKKQNPSLSPIWEAEL